MPRLTSLDPPGGVADLDEDSALRRAWTGTVSAMFDDAVGRARQLAPRPQFYNPLRVSTDANAARSEITWRGFPQVILRAAGGRRGVAYRRADQPVQLRQERSHDEYLEWHVVRDPTTRKIVRIDFTTEPPEYFEFLAARAPDILLDLYRRHISPAVTIGDLYDTGGYVKLNRWNTRDGAMHLTHPSNSLRAELRLAADATILRRRGNRLLTDAQELIECAGYGEPARASDPRIGADVNALAREGYAVTVENPVGLSMKGINTQGWTKPDGAPIGRYFRVLRGTPGNTVRAVFEVPSRARAAGQRFVVGDILIGGQRIEFGGQVAEAITVKLTGLASRKGQLTNPARVCRS